MPAAIPGDRLAVVLLFGIPRRFQFQHSLQA